MSQQHDFEELTPMFAFVALSSVLLASDEQAPSSRPRCEPASQRGSSALFTWGDCDGDGKLDLAAVSEQGRLQLLLNAGEGRFEDITERAGLAGIQNAELALWADYDKDGSVDLFVGAREGRSLLFRNRGMGEGATSGAFTEVSEACALVCEGAVRSAHWLDHDGDGLLDLHVVTAEHNLLFRGMDSGGIEGGFFKRTELALSSDTLPLPSFAGSFREAPRGPLDAGPNEGEPGGGRRVVGGSLVSPGSPSEPRELAITCVPEIADQSSAGCIQASSTPMLGLLYPISSNLFVAVSGDVGIGTTSPTARLHVAGTARVTDTLTLAPSGDQALNISTGSIYKEGLLFIHSTNWTLNTAIGTQALANVGTGPSYGNTASGFRALYSNFFGPLNTANGARALQSNTYGGGNTACGSDALMSNTTGYVNTACGSSTLVLNTTGEFNTAIGAVALRNNTTGAYNTAVGGRALFSVTTGSRNIGIGAGTSGGASLTSGNDNVAIANSGVAGESATIRIGTAGSQTRAFIAGIRGVTTGAANAIPVLVDSAGQLGTVSSSRRFKEDIADMGDRTERLLELRPVVFRYKPEVQPGERPLEYGLIAEEVAEIFPELVVYDEEGMPLTVKYHLLSSMLLNELKGLSERLEARERDSAREVEALSSRLAALEKLVVAQASPGALTAR